MSGLKRREFITLLGGAAAAWPLAARAQQQTTIRKVGLLHSGASTVVNMRVAAIREGLSVPDNQRDLSLEIIVRLADGDVSRLPALATDLVNNRVDAIVAAAPPAVQAAASATNSIPVIAIDLESDPIASGFVRSLARPGGNVTGVFLDFPDFQCKVPAVAHRVRSNTLRRRRTVGPNHGRPTAQGCRGSRAGIWHRCAGIRGATCSRHCGGILCGRPLAHPGPTIAVVATSCRQSAIDRGPRDPKKCPDDLSIPRNCTSGRVARLWARDPGSFSPGGGNGAQGSAWRKSGRVARGTPHAIQTGHQP